MFNAKERKLIKWNFVIDKGIGSVNFFLLEESCHFYFMFIYYKKTMLTVTSHEWDNYPEVDL